MSAMKIENSAWLVTGGSGGIGLAVARMALERGARRVILAARSADGLDRAKAAIKSAAPGADVSARPLDVCDEAAVFGLARELAGEDLSPDVVVNSAGIVLPGLALDQTPGDFRRQTEVNYFGCVNVCLAFAPGMVAAGRGHLLNISSLAGAIPVYGMAGYCASKFALNGFTEALRSELRPAGVGVSVVLPPDTDTPMLAAELPLRPEGTRRVAGTIRPVPPETVARAILSGIETGRAVIIPDLTSRMMCRLAGAMPGLVRRYSDARTRNGR